MQKVLKIFLYTVPVLGMIGLIPVVESDYLLAGLYTVLIGIVLVAIKAKKTDLIAFFFGLFAMTFFEYIFISTGVETFTRNSLFGMPLWLPLLWAYGFVAIKRSVVILES